MSPQRPAASPPSCSPTSRRPRTPRRGWAMTPPPRVRTHDRIVREQFAAHGGRVLDPRATASWRCSTRRAARSRARWRSNTTSRRNRTAPASGSASMRARCEDGGEPFGAAINLAARVMDRAAAARSSSRTPCASSRARCPARAFATAAASRSRASPSASACTRCTRPTDGPARRRRRAAGRGARSGPARPPGAAAAACAGP